jgi:hypothetical protein
MQSSARFHDADKVISVEPSRPGRRDSISGKNFMKTCILLLTFVGVTFGQTKSNKPSESPEHKFARERSERYHKLFAEFEEAEAELQSLDDIFHKAAMERADKLLEFGRSVAAGKNQDETPQEFLAKLDRDTPSQAPLHKQQDLLNEKVNSILVAMNSMGLRLSSGQDVPLLEQQLQHVDECVAVYHRTIDKKNSDLTVRETEAVNGCKALQLYPPSK